MNASSPVTQGLLSRFLSRLRFPQLFVLTATLFVVDFLIPDFIPFIDELMLGLLAAMFGLIRQRRESAADPAPTSAPRAPVKDVTPR